MKHRCIRNTAKCMCIHIFATSQKIHLYMHNTTNATCINMSMHAFVHIHAHLHTHYTHAHARVYMFLCLCAGLWGWLRLVGSLKLQVSFAEYHIFYRAFAKETCNFKEPTNRSHQVSYRLQTKQQVYTQYVYICKKVYGGL